MPKLSPLNVIPLLPGTNCGQCGEQTCMSFAVKLLDQKEYLAEALEIAVRNKITIYDALFIALAKNLNTELITSDTRQAKTAKREGVETIIV